MDNTDPTLPTTVQPEDVRIEETSHPYVGRWNGLVSTTNWEKGRIITQWREALMETGALASDYSDEAWSRRVGSVTGQHVGRLRRVYQRFGEVHEEYVGLYWSHFQAALDWEDAEMWLEGAVQNRWSVSQMRHTRWETLGAISDDEPRDEDIVVAEIDDDFEPSLSDPPDSQQVIHDSEDVPDTTGPTQVRSEPTAQADAAEETPPDDGANIYADEDKRETIDFVRPFENLADLPEDLAEAFELFKLAILRHKTEQWQQISREDMLASLDALKELVVAPSAEEATF
ncbi:MAG: hypothetical protein ACC628_10485 [Pirellulaceae bacterium]